MGLFSKDAPQVPQAADTSRQQLQYGTKAAQAQQKLNTIDRAGPFGSSTFERDEKGLPTGITNTLSEPLQQGAEGIQGTYSNLSGLLPQTPFSSTDAAPDTSDISQTFYNQGYGLLKPHFDQQQKQFETRMAERGLPVATGGEQGGGSEIYQDQSNLLAQQQGNQLNDLAMRSSLAAPSEQQRLIQNARADYTQNPQMLAAYGQNLGLLRGLTPQAAQPSASIQAPNHQQNVANQYNAEMQQYQNQQEGLGSMLGTLGSIAMAPTTGGGSLFGNYLGKKTGIV